MGKQSLDLGNAGTYLRVRAEHAQQRALDQLWSFARKVVNVLYGQTGRRKHNGVPLEARTAHQVPARVTKPSRFCKSRPAPGARPRRVCLFFRRKEHEGEGQYENNSPRPFSKKKSPVPSSTKTIHRSFQRDKWKWPDRLSRPRKRRFEMISLSSPVVRLKKC